MLKLIRNAELMCSLTLTILKSFGKADTIIPNYESRIPN